MQILLFLLIFIIGLGSLITSFVAIIQILSNDFKESKIQWILISMIAFIGPILWLTKGRKLIIKNGQSLRNENTEKISLSEHYTQLIKNIGIPLKILTLIALILILYGYFARALNIYFFWESKSIGFGLLLFAIAKFILDDINARQENKMHRIILYFVFGILCLSIFIKGIIAIIIPNSDAYNKATDLLKTDSELIDEVGEINSFSYLPSGSMGTHKDKYGTTGNANLTLIVKGNKKYIEKNVVLVKELEEDWKIISLN
jgi:hypothetical protein